MSVSLSPPLGSNEIHRKDTHTHKKKSQQTKKRRKMEKKNAEQEVHLFCSFFFPEHSTQTSSSDLQQPLFTAFTDGFKKVCF